MVFTAGARVAGFSVLSVGGAIVIARRTMVRCFGIERVTALILAIPVACNADLWLAARTAVLAKTPKAK